MAPGDLSGKVVLRHSRILPLLRRPRLRKPGADSHAGDHAVDGDEFCALDRLCADLSGSRHGRSRAAGDVLQPGRARPYRRLARAKLCAGGDLEFTLSLGQRLASAARHHRRRTAGSAQQRRSTAGRDPSRRHFDSGTEARPSGVGADKRVVRFPFRIWRAGAFVHFPLTGTVFPCPGSRRSTSASRPPRILCGSVVAARRHRASPVFALRAR